ncbi:MAG: FUSC family protein, partial [Actinomycetes bacterium]
VMGLLGFAAFGGPNRDRFLAYVITGSVGVVVVAAGSLAAFSTVSAVAFAVIIAWSFTYAGVLRGYVGAAGSAIIMPMAIALTSPPSVAAIPDRLIGWAVGTAFATAGALLLWPVYRRSLLRTKIAAALRAESEAVRILWAPRPEVTAAEAGQAAAMVTDAIEDVRREFDGRFARPGEATARDRALIMAVDEMLRLRSLIRWARNVGTAPRSAPDFALAHTTSEMLAQCAAALESKGEAPYPSVMNTAREQHWLGVVEAANAEIAAGNAPVTEAAAAESFKIRLAALQCQMIANDIRGAVGAPADPHPEATMEGVRWRVPDHRVSPLRILVDQFTFSSPWFRTSLRAGLAVGLGILAVELLDLKHGFWVVLGTLSALRLDAVATRRTAMQAFAGTVVGFIIGVIGLTVFTGQSWPAWVALPICVFLAVYTPGAVSVWVGQAAFTLFVITLFALYEPSRYATAEVRLTDVTIGVAISAVISMLMWPRGVITMVRTRLATGLTCAADYLVAAYERASFGAVMDATADASATACAIAMERANETFDLASSQAGQKLTHVELWATVDNIANQIAYAAEIVTALARMGLFEANSQAVDDAMLASAQRIRARFQASTMDLQAIDEQTAETKASDRKLAPRSATESMKIDDGLDVVREKVLECLQGMTGDAESRSGAHATSLVWSQEWLVHASWLAGRLEFVVAPS